MGFNEFQENAIFFIGITLILFAKSNSKPASPSARPQKKPFFFHSNDLNTRSTPSQLEYEISDDNPNPNEIVSTTLKNDRIPSDDPSGILSQVLGRVLPISQQNEEKCEPLKVDYAPRELLDILSPEIFSQADPLRYIVDKTLKIEGLKIAFLIGEVNSLLKTNRLPQCYIPYAKTLTSFIRCWLDIFEDRIPQFMNYIQKFSSPNYTDFSFLPPDIVSSMSTELLEIFSADFFTDPMLPLRFFYKLLNMPKNSIRNLEVQLQGFVEATSELCQSLPFRKRFYIWYPGAVMKFLQNESALDDLKRDVDTMQRMANYNRPLLPATSKL